MSILLIELESLKGHHISSYLRSIVKVLSIKKKKIFFLTTKEIKKSTFYRFYKKNTKIIYAPKIEYPKKKTNFNFLIFQIKNYILIKNIFKKIYIKYKIDHVYLNTLDFFDKPISIFGSPFENIKFSGLFLNPKFNINHNFNNINNLKKTLYEKLFLKMLKFKNLEKVFFVDPITFYYLKKKKLKYKNKITFIEDIGTANPINKISLTKIKCKKILNIKKNNYVVLLYGSIRENKSINELLEAYNSMKNKENVTILIAGLQDNDAKEVLNRSSLKKNYFRDNFIFINKFINDKLEKIVFKAADITWVGYSKNFFGSTGVLFLSSQNFTPVIGSNHGALGWYLKKYKIGFAEDLTKTKKIINIFEQHMYKKRKFNFNFKKANKNRNFENFGKKIFNNLII